MSAVNRRQFGTILNRAGASIGPDYVRRCKARRARGIAAFAKWMSAE